MQPSGPAGRTGPPRRDPEDFFAAAYGLLAQSGCAGLTVAALCGRVGVSKGSFYHHFEDMPDFVEQFAARWQAWLAERFAKYTSMPDVRRKLEVINWAHVMVAPGAQAMRAWGRTNPAVEQSLISLQRLTRDTCVQLWGSLAKDEITGPVLGAMGNVLVAGIQLRPRPLNRERWLRLSAPLFGVCDVKTELSRLEGLPYLKVLAAPGTRSVTVADVFVEAATPSIHDGPHELTAGSDARSRFLAAGRDLLREGGADALTIVGLAERMEVTKGSFQHHFGSMPAFVEAMAGSWEQSVHDRTEQALRERNPWRALERLIGAMLDEPDPAETAWRAWSHTNRCVGAAVLRADDRREQALTLTLRRVVDSPQTELLAELTLGLVDGLHQWQPAFDSTLKARAAVEWMRRVVGVDAEIRFEDGAARLRFQAA